GREDREQDADQYAAPLAILFPHERGSILPSRRPCGQGGATASRRDDDVAERRGEEVFGSDALPPWHTRPRDEREDPIRPVRNPDGQGQTDEDGIAQGKAGTGGRSPRKPAGIREA